MRRDDRGHWLDLAYVCAGVCVWRNASLWLKLRSEGWVRVKQVWESERKEEFPCRGKASARALRWPWVKYPWGLGGGWIPAGVCYLLWPKAGAALVPEANNSLQHGHTRCVGLGPRPRVVAWRPSSHFLQQESLPFLKSTCIFQHVSWTGDERWT